MGATLNQLLDLCVQRAPNRTALVLLEGGAAREMTYGELSKLVLQAAAAFQSRGVGPGDRVAIVHRNGLGFVVAYFGLVRLGATAVPINYMIQNPQELAYMLRHCSAKGIVAQRDFLRGLTAARKGLPLLKYLWLTDSRGAGEGHEDFWTFIEGHPPLPGSDGPGPASPESVATILYTSGTTGNPKGVMLTHDNLVSNCDASIRAMALDKSDVMLTLLPMFHTFSWTVCVLIPLRLGARMVVVPSLTPPNIWIRAMGRYGVTLFVAVPQIFSLLAKQAVGLVAILMRLWFFRKVRLYVSGAGPLSPTTYAEFRAALGPEILQGYGLTETSPVATINRPGAALPESCGTPLEGVELRICDDAGQALPAGAEGEILIRGPNVMKGYLDDPEATAQAIDPEGWLRTGDIGSLDGEGRLTIRDRKKDMIIVKGLKVFSAQIESILSGHPDVAEAAVIGVPDERKDERIKAFVVLRKGAAASKADLLRYCRERLDPYKRPRSVEIVAELPKNALQKVLKRELRQRESR